MLAEFVLGILAMTIVMWFSRWREYRADRGGAELAGRHNMIAALRRLQQTYDPRALPDELAAFAISAGKVQKLFASHPPLEQRIAALESADN
jgi:heat shock protein HtpX